MFSQSQIDSMSIEELVKLIRSIAIEVENRIDNPDDAYDYSNSLRFLTDSLHNKVSDLVD